MELAVIIGLVVYFIPTVIAFMRGHASRWGIFIFNFVFGITGVLWIAALIWATSNRGNQMQNIIVNNNQQVGK